MDRTDVKKPNTNIKDNKSKNQNNIKNIKNCFSVMNITSY